MSRIPHVLACIVLALLATHVAEGATAFPTTRPEANASRVPAALELVNILSGSPPRETAYRYLHDLNPQVLSQRESRVRELVGARAGVFDRSTRCLTLEWMTFSKNGLARHELAIVAPKDGNALLQQHLDRMKPLEVDLYAWRWPGSLQPAPIRVTDNQWAFVRTLTEQALEAQKPRAEALRAEQQRQIEPLALGIVAFWDGDRWQSGMWFLSDEMEEQAVSNLVKVVTYLSGSYGVPPVSVDDDVIDQFRALNRQR